MTSLEQGRQSQQQTLLQTACSCLKIHVGHTRFSPYCMLRCRCGSTVPSNENFGGVGDATRIIVLGNVMVSRKSGHADVHDRRTQANKNSLSGCPRGVRKYALFALLFGATTFDVVCLSDLPCPPPSSSHGVSNLFPYLPFPGRKPGHHKRESRKCFVYHRHLQRVIPFRILPGCDWVPGVRRCDGLQLHAGTWHWERYHRRLPSSHHFFYIDSVPNITISRNTAKSLVGVPD